jgi:hypothetical protein
MQFVLNMCALDQLAKPCPLCRRGGREIERRLNQAARWRTLQRARRMRRELFLFVEEGGDGFLFLLDDASDIGGDIRIPGCPNDPQGHASGVF